MLLARSEAPKPPSKLPTRGPVWPKRAFSAAIVRSQTRCRMWPAADRVARDHRDDRLRQAADLHVEVADVEPADALLDATSSSPM